MFLQSKVWSDFQKRAGSKVIILDKGSGAWAVQFDMPFGMNYLYSPYFEYADKLIKEGEKRKSVFVKCEPMSEDKAVDKSLKEPEI